MSEWREIKLKEICSDIAYGYTASATDENTGTKFLRITDIVNTPFNWNTVPYCSISQKDAEKYKVYPGDIVIARTGATTGTTYTIKDNVNAVFASYLIRYKIDRLKANPFFIGYNLISENWKGFVENIIGGSAQPGANAQQFGDYDLIIPSLSQQDAIAEILGSLDDKIDLLHRNNKTLEQLAETLFRQWFVENKEGSHTIQLGEIANVTSGKGLKQSEFSDNGRYPVLGANGLIGRVDKFLYNEELIITGRVGTLGSVYIIDEETWISDNVLIVKPKESKHFYNTYFSMKDFDYEGLNVGSTQPLLTQTELKKQYVFVGDDRLMKRFDETCSSFFAKIKSNKKQISNIEILRDNLLPNLMSGAVRVTN